MPPQAAAGQPQWQGEPGPSYISPIPITRTHLGHALASEWTKIRSVRSTMWTLGVMLVLVIGMGTLVAVGISASDAEVGAGSVLGLGFFGVLLGTLCVITLGVLTISSEYGTGMIRTTTTACPSRGRILGAKAIVFFLLVFTITTVSTALVGVIQSAIVDAGSPSGADWFRSTVGVGLYVATIGLVSLAVGALVRHSAGAITIMIGVVLLPLVLAMFMFAESLNDLRQILFEYSIPNQLGALYSNAVTDSGPQGWEPLWIMLGVAAVALAGAFFSTEVRDV
ncbi:ABC transporter permease [Streptomyces monticola]|uniref:ABC transporter permease n=1 Tax=Streptomyces monticola TaxID=2666263 RepID=A0ABW2JGA5_9ACTN